MAIRKQFLKGRPVCKVTFNISEKVGKEATQAHVAGEFNGWSASATPMKRFKNETFSATVELEKDCSYRWF